MIRIGADEIILWLRKNRIAANITNDKINGLGRRIYDLIIELGGTKIDELDDSESYWPCIEHEHIGEKQLPKTSAQYEIDENRLPELYRRIMTWN